MEPVTPPAAPQNVRLGSVVDEWIGVVFIRIFYPMVAEAQTRLGTTQRASPQNGMSSSASPTAAGVLAWGIGRFSPELPPHGVSGAGLVLAPFFNFRQRLAPRVIMAA